MHPTPKKAASPARDIAAALRVLMARRIARGAGARRANPFRALAVSVLRRAASVCAFRSRRPGRTFLTVTIPTGPFALSALGLGLAGGGGGSPGPGLSVAQI